MPPAQTRKLFLKQAVQFLLLTRKPSLKASVTLLATANRVYLKMSVHKQALIDSVFVGQEAILLKKKQNKQKNLLGFL